MRINLQRRRHPKHHVKRRLFLAALQSPQVAAIHVSG